MNHSRTTNSVYNSIANLSNNMLITILSFIVRTVFIKILGEQCLGLDGLFTNIIGLLSLAELGVGTAFSFSLYKPLAEKSNDRIDSLMTFFKKCYRIIALIILGIGLIVLPFIGVIAKDYSSTYNLYLIFFMYLINTVSSYIFSYPCLLIEADQKGYKLIRISIISNIISYGLQLLSLILIKNLYFVLLSNFIVRITEYILKNKYVRKKYSLITFNSKKEISNEDKKDIKKILSGVIYHRVGNYFVDGTDNILISSIVNISTTGIYFNYCSITSILRNLLGGIINSVTASFGNLNVTESKETKENVFNIINFGTYFISGLLVIGTFFCINPFIKMWIGENYTLPFLTVAIICINFYIINIILPVDAIKASVGVYYQDRYVPIIQAVVNILLSILLGKKFGIDGILIATTICKLTTVNWTKPLTLYKYVFESKSRYYFCSLICNCMIVCMSIVIFIFIKPFLVFKSLFIQFIANGLISCLIYLLLSYIFYRNKKEFIYFKGFILGKLKRKRI